MPSYPAMCWKDILPWQTVPLPLVWQVYQSSGGGVSVTFAVAAAPGPARSAADTATGATASPNRSATAPRRGYARCRFIMMTSV